LYTIEIANGLLSSYDFRRWPASRYVIITDATVARLYGGPLARRVEGQGFPVTTIVFAPGERLTKRWQTVVALGRQCARLGVDRQAVVLVLGGGVVGDVAGLFAALYHRGLRYVQLPTTLLAQTDSAIGGKTGVNLPEGKNLLGAFWNPLAVLVDPTTLRSLPTRQLRSGLAEVVKYGVMLDRKLFRYLERRGRALDQGFLRTVVERSAALKAAIDERDPRERGVRSVCNYGHTVGHALELLSCHRLTHGEAIALGMVAEGWLAVQRGFWSERDWQRQNTLLTSLGLPTTCRVDPAAVLALTARDKKAVSGERRLPLPIGIGRHYEEDGVVTVPVEPELLGQAVATLGEQR
jgi:3-dehydroquinate synthase